MDLIKNNKIYPKSYIIDLEEEEYKKILVYMKNHIIKNNYDINKDKNKIILLYNLYNYLF
jgi:hypothetical protein